MAGVGKLIKQAQKMQRQMEQIQATLAERTIEVSSGGGAVVVGINGLGEFKSLKLDPELLKEDASFVEETILGAVKEAAAEAKQVNEAEMKSVTAGMSMPGMF
jgi:DNA-binding YbaB/EbfC family protein